MIQHSLFSVANRGNIKSFLATMGVNGGMSFSNGYLVKFLFNSGSVVPGALDSAGISFNSASNDVIELFCDEAQLPNIAASSGNQVGRFVGETSVKYPTAKIFSEIQLGWMCDANMTPNKFLNIWFESMFIENGSLDSYSSPSVISGQQFDDVITNPLTRTKNRGTQLRYPNEYQCDILIAKAESGPDSPTQRVSEIYVLEQAWPISIDSVPLSYGASQVTKSSAQFAYTRHYIIYNDIKSLNTLAGKNSRSKKSKKNNLPIGANDIPPSIGLGLS